MVWGSAAKLHKFRLVQSGKLRKTKCMICEMPRG